MTSSRDSAAIPFAQVERWLLVGSGSDAWHWRERLLVTDPTVPVEWVCRTPVPSESPLPSSAGRALAVTPASSAVVTATGESRSWTGPTQAVEVWLQRTSPGERAATVAIVATPESDDPVLLRALLAAGVPILADRPVQMVPSAIAECRQLAGNVGRPLVFVARGLEDDDFQTALQAVHGQRLGTLHSARYVSAEWGVSPSGMATLPPPSAIRTAGALLTDLVRQLQRLWPARVVEVTARGLDREAGLLATLEMETGGYALLDLRRRSTAGLRTGWMLEGAQAGFSGRRLITPTADGELVDEPVRLDRDTEQQSWRSGLSSLSLAENQADLVAWQQVMETVVAIRTSASLGRTVAVAAATAGLSSLRNHPHE